MELRKLLDARTCGNIAIVGLSPDESKDSHKVGKYLHEHGFKILPIYPLNLLKSPKILNLKVYDNLVECANENQIDIVVMFRKGEYASILADEIIKNNIKIKCFWMQLGIDNQSAKEMLSKIGIEVIEDKCIKIEHQKL